MLAESVAGELIRSEIEIRSGRGETLRRRGGQAARGALAPVRARGRERRPARRHRHAPVEPVAGAADHRHRPLPPRARSGSSTWPGGTTRSACTCTWGCAGRSGRCGCATGCGAVMPELLAISANSPFLDGRHSGLHSARTQIFTKSFPRCGIPDAVRRAGRPTPTTSTSSCGRTRSTSSRRSGGACGRTTPTARSRCGSATRRRAGTTRRRWRR